MDGGDRGAWSPSALCALGAFGLTTSDVDGRAGEHVKRAEELAPRVDAELGAGEVMLVRGPSGAGKSTLLRAVAARVRRRGGVVIEPRLCEAMGERRVIDVIAKGEGDVARSLRVLSAAGLADAMIPARLVRELSDGQRARLGVAMAVREAEQRGGAGLATVVIDELASTLDETTGRGLCITLARWARRVGNVRVIAASARERCGEWLGADVVVDAATGGVERVRRAAPMVVADEGIEIGRGTIWDYRAMAHWHYRARAPATCVGVLVARAAGERVGVLVVSMPTLNGAWRERAWPGRYGGRGVCKRAAARRINREVRCISRVIVDPRYRGRGVGAELVRRYLGEPLTGRTEAVAAMGAASPMFVRAGMREWIGEPTERDARLIDALASAGMCPWFIADVRETAQRVRESRGLERSFRAWAMKHGATRALAGGPVEEIIACAARTIVRRPRAYTAGE